MSSSTPNTNYEDDVKYSPAQDERSINNSNDRAGDHAGYDASNEVMMSNVVPQEEQTNANANNSNNNVGNDSGSSSGCPESSGSGGDVIIHIYEQRGDAPTNATTTTSNGASNEGATTTAASDPDPTNPNGILLTAEEERISKWLKDNGNGYHQALDHDPALAARTRLLQRIILGVGGFCFGTSWLWVIALWILKVTMNPSCWNGFEEHKGADFKKFQETWNFCYLTFWPMNLVTFCHWFPLITGILGCAAGILNLRMTCLLGGTFLLFTVAVMLVLIILAFCFGFPAIFPLVLAAYMFLALVVGIMMLVIIKPMGLINKAEQKKRVLRKKLGLVNNTNNRN